jgi:hypothetical protein
MVNFLIKCFILFFLIDQRYAEAELEVCRGRVRGIFFSWFYGFLTKENVVMHSEYIELIILPMCPTDGL